MTSHSIAVIKLHKLLFLILCLAVHPLVKKICYDYLNFCSFVFFILLQGKLNVREHVFEGFEKMPRAFMSLFQGENIGKVVVKL